MSDLDAMRSAERTEIAGVPTYTAETPGKARALLLFRVGQSDETLSTRGLTHLVEHLALGSDARSDVPQGLVTLTTTLVMIEGAPDEVAARLASVAHRFAEPPLERLEVERRVLAVEDASSPAPASTDVYGLHFGARGPGLVGKRELGLRRATASEVARHASAWFTRGNAALVLSRPLPALKDLTLPDGPRRPMPAHPLVRRRPMPCEANVGDAPFALGGPVPNSDAAPVLGVLLERLAWRALRHDRGLAYDVDCRAEPVGPETRFITLTTDAGRGGAGEAARLMFEAIRAIARGEIDQNELAAAKDDIIRRRADDPLPGLAGLLIAEIAFGRRRSPDEALNALAAVTADEVAAAAGALADRLIATLPDGEKSGILPRLQGGAERPVDGVRHTLTQAADAAEMIVGEAGVTIIDDHGASATVHFADCVAAVQHPTGAIVLVAPNGDSINIDPRHVADGAAIVAQVIRAVRPEVVVPPDRNEVPSEARLRTRTPAGPSTSTARITYSDGRYALGSSHRLAGVSM